MPPRDQLADQFRRRVEQFVLVRTDVGNFGVPSQSGVKATRDRKTAQRISGFDLAEPRRTTQREQRVVGDAAERLTQHCGQRQLVGLVVEEAQQLNEIRDLFTLVKTAAQHGLIRDVRAAKD